MACVILHVYDDGDVELSRVGGEPRSGFQSLNLSYSDIQVKRGVLKKELMSYGPEESEIDTAIKHIMSAPEGTSCIVGKYSLQKDKNV